MTTKKSISGKKISSTPLLLILLSIISFFLRFHMLPENLFFGPEQGIDFLAIKDIVVHHNLTLIGAKTDVIGIFHGPIYYYIASLPFLLSGGDPIIVITFLLLLNVITIFIIYLFTKDLFNERVGVIAAILFTVSYGAIVYSRWLSSHPLVIPLSALFFYFLYKFIKKEKHIFLYSAAFVFGLLGQAEFLNFLFFSVIVILVAVLYREKIKKELLITYLIAFVILTISAVGNFILFDLKHQFLISKSVFSLASHDSGFYQTFGDSLIHAIKVFSIAIPLFVMPFLPILFTLCLIFFFVSVYKEHDTNKRKALLLISVWLLTPLIILIFLRHDVLDQFFVGSAIAAIIMVSYVIERLHRHTPVLGVLFVGFLIIINVSAWQKNIPINTNVFFHSSQPRLKLSDQRKVIDAIYASAEKKDFSIQAFTIPYWKQEGWEYLFWYYGNKYYGYEPIKQKAKKLYVIIQQDEDKYYQKNWLRDTVSNWGKEKKQFSYGILTVKELAVE